jgi:hypothetical protein
MSLNQVVARGETEKRREDVEALLTRLGSAPAVQECDCGAHVRSPEVRRARRDRLELCRDRVLGLALDEHSDDMFPAMGFDERVDLFRDPRRLRRGR